MRFATSSDGVRLAVHETGQGPPIVAVHGYPDNHRVWDALTEQLLDRFRVITYDVRGCGDSDQPADRAAYRMERLVDDLAAVLAVVSPAEPVHLLGHDWGSVQCWPALTDTRLVGRIASFTSISGPSLEHTARWLRGGRRYPRAALRQAAMSWYTLAFQVPWLPEFAARRGWIGALTSGRKARRDSVIPRSTSDAVNGLQLYRANMRTRHPEPRRVEVPVLVLAPEHDRYVSVALQTRAPEPHVRDLRTEVLAAGHWAIVRHAAEVAQLVGGFVSGHAA